MHVREPSDFKEVKNERRARRRWQHARRFSLVLLILVLVVALVGYVSYARPLPVAAAKVTQPVLTSEQVALAWPSGGQAAIGAQGQGVLSSTSSQTPVPTASVAKVMTALAVLKKYPLQQGQTGPTITIDAEDVQLFNQYVGQGGSVVRVVAGEQISEYQALQAILLPSANNMADAMAIWAYGSMDAYHVAANQLAQGLGMTQSKFAGDASGFLPDTVSTAHDLVLLGQAALEQPVLKQIFHQQSAEIPVAGTILNTNVMLGRNNIIGVKTGNSDEAGGCYLFAAEQKLTNGKSVTAIGAIMASPSLAQAMQATNPLLTSFYQGFSDMVVVPKNTVVATYQSPWGEKTTAVVQDDLKVMAWHGTKPSVSVKVDPLAMPSTIKSRVGMVTAQTAYANAAVEVVTTSPITAPTWRWRVLR